MRQLWAKTTTNQYQNIAYFTLTLLSIMIPYIHVLTLLEQENSTLTSCTSGLRNSSTLFMECSITWPFSSVSSFELFSITSSDILMFLMFCKTHGNTILRHFNFFSFILLTAVKVKKKVLCFCWCFFHCCFFLQEFYSWCACIHETPPFLYSSKNQRGCVTAVQFILFNFANYLPSIDSLWNLK